MEREIREQPEVLSRGASNYSAPLRDALSKRDIELVLLVARGSSDNAALFGRYLIEVYLGIPVSLAAPSVLTRYGRKIDYKKTLAVGISQSGAAPDVSEVIRSLREEGHLTLGITNTEGSRLSSEAEFSLDLAAGLERSVAATKTYSASLLAMYEIVRAMGGDLPDPAGLMPTEEWVETAREAAASASGPVIRSAPVFALGRGYSFATAQESALKLMECALIACKSYSSADFEHGPKALAGYGSAVISYAGALDELHAQGSDIVIAPEPTVPEPLKPIWESIYAQWLALHAARARGLNPDDPRHIRKVTTTL